MMQFIFKLKMIIGGFVLGFKKSRERCKTPTVLQIEATECGAASLGMILGYYGRHVPLAKLRQDCGISRDGSKAANILKAAKLYGCKTRGSAKSFKKLLDTKLPGIIFWNFNHFVTLEGFGNETVYINDPGMGHRKVGLEEFKKNYSGVFLSIEPTDEFEKKGKPVTALPALLRAVRGNGIPMIFSLICGLVAVVPNLALPVCTSVFIDSILIEQRTGWFRPLLTFMVGSLLLQQAILYFKLHVNRRFVLALSARLNSQFLQHLLRLPISFFTQRFPGEIVTRTGLNDQIAQTVTGPLTSIVVDIVTMLLYGVILMYFNPVLTLIGIVFTAVNFGILSLVSSSREEASLNASQGMGRVHGTVIAGVQSIETIKSGGQEQAFFSKWGGHYSKGMNSAQKLQKTSLSIGILPTLAGRLTELVILLIGGIQVMQGTMTIGMLVAFKALMDNFQAPIGNLFGFATNLQELRASIIRVNDVLNNPTLKEVSVETEKDESGNIIVNRREKLDVNNISFGFNPISPPLIENFSLNLVPGRSVALVGESGSGKSTIGKIICGLYDPWEGSVCLDGKDIREIPRLIRRNSLGLVEQEFGIFEGTVRENLTLWDPTVPDKVLEQACEVADVLAVIQNMPGSLDAQMLENGANLSGGQRQRLELARALVHQPSVLVLDEATSALDAETERRVMINLKRLGCTTVVVAHRLSTIRDSDEIIVLHRGGVIERGQHEQLIANEGPYFNLVQRSLEEGEES